MQLIKEIHKKLASAVSLILKVEPSDIIKLFEKPKNPSHGDISLPCFTLAKNLEIKPIDLSKKISENLLLPKEIASAIPMGPFVNFKLNYLEMYKYIISEDAVNIASKNLNKQANTLSDSVIVEYSSPNIAKPFHVGHLRATLIGNCLDRAYRYAGYKTESINHLGDWGTQFGYVWAGCNLWGEPEEFNVKNLVSLYKKATTLKDEQEKEGSSEKDNSIVRMARDYFINLENGAEDAVNFWKRCVDVSLLYLKDTYSRLDINFDHYLGESFYSDKLKDIEEELIKSGLLIESQGAKGVDLGEKMGFARIFTPDGRSLYLTRDLAAADYRFKTFNFSKSIYVVGSPQTLHFNQIKGILSLLKKPYANSIIHVAFGHVLGMKTRGEGQAIELNEFLDEAFERALNAYRFQVSKRPENTDENEVASKVSKSAIIFSTLNKTNIKDVNFSWDDALSFQGDSGPYLLYAYARISSILEKASLQGLSLDYNNFEASKEILSKPEAEQLLSCIIAFDEALENLIKSNEPLFMCSYALELAKQISKAYLSLRVIGEEKNKAETALSLFITARNQLKKAFNILGFEPLERM